MSRLFGTDGVRGVANQEPMTVETVLQIGRAIAHVCRKYEKSVRHRILIGKDTRVSGYMLENALTAGICSMGVDVLLVGPMPTPGIAFITRSMRADAGVVLSASHNPYQDNGIKIFSRDGYKLPDSEENEIEELIRSGSIRDIRPTADEVGKAKRIDDALGRYIVFCKSAFPETESLEGLKLAIDCANGATYKVAPIIFSELGAELAVIHNQPDGMNINYRCGSQHTSDLRKLVVESGADVGLAFDGDGDRLIVIDETGVELNGDHMLALCAKHAKDRGELPGNRVVTTVMANFGLFRTLKNLGIQVDVAPVGDRHVLQRMREKGALLGGEASGHMIFLDDHTTGDGIISALRLLAVLCETRRPVSELASLVQLTPQKLINVDVLRQPPLDELPEVQAAIRSVEEELGDQGRVLIRYSGTQALCRVMVEGPTEERTGALAEQLAAVIRKKLG